MSAWVDAQLSDNRFALSVVALFALAAGILALVGLYGVVSVAVGQRTREIGIRMALGSERQAILMLIVKDGLKLTLIGIGLGLLGAVGLTRFLATLLFELETTDPATFAGTALALVLTGVVASLVPALRASRVDPVEVLNGE